MQSAYYQVMMVRSAAVVLASGMLSAVQQRKGSTAWMLTNVWQRQLLIDGGPEHQLHPPRSAS